MGLMFWLVLFSFSSVICEGAIDKLNVTSPVRQARDYTTQGYSYGSGPGNAGPITGGSHQPGYEIYEHYGQPSYTLGHLEKWPFHIPPAITGGGCGVSGLLKGLVLGVGVGLLLKLFLLKVLLVKAALPLGMLLAAAPVILPLLYVLRVTAASHDKEDPLPTTPGPSMMMSGRSSSLHPETVWDLLESPACLQKLACRLGASHATTPYVQPITWGLSTLESMWPNLFSESKANEDVTKAKILGYRTAYKDGASTKGQACFKFQCKIPKMQFFES